LVLTDREIQAALQCGQIQIKPLPGVDAYSSTSVDLTLSKFIRTWKGDPLKGVEQVICPSAEGYNFNELLKNLSDSKELGIEGYVIKPQEFVLGWTEETIELPTSSRIAARVEGKSSLARLGIGIHITAPTIHAGFPGPIQLEICNHGIMRVKLVPGMRVCQLIFEQTLGTPDKGYAGQFFRQQKS
jgi:dCTP deaminase